MNGKALKARDINYNQLHGNHVHIQRETKEDKANGKCNGVVHARTSLVVPEPKRFNSIHLNAKKPYDCAKDHAPINTNGSPDIASMAPVSWQPPFYHGFPYYPYFPFGYPGYQIPMYPDFVDRHGIHQRYLEGSFGYLRSSSFPQLLAQYSLPKNQIGDCIQKNQPKKLEEEENAIKEENTIQEETPEDGSHNDTSHRKMKCPNKPVKSNVCTTKKADNSMYPCSWCDKRYYSFVGLSKHKQFHCSQDATNTFTCKYCEKIYVSLGALKMHLRTHTLPCKCKICEKAFSRPWLLQGHLRTHTGEKPFTCVHCLRAFADRSNLRAHMQTHSDVKKYNCMACSKTFSRMSLLLKHGPICKESTI